MNIIKFITKAIKTMSARMQLASFYKNNMRREMNKLESFHLSNRIDELRAELMFTNRYNVHTAAKNIIEKELCKLIVKNNRIKSFIK